MTDPRPEHGPERDGADRDRVERDRILRRVRGTTAVAGVGAVVVTGALAGWLGHAASADTEAATPASTSTSSTGTGSSATDSLSSPTASPTTDTSGGDDQPSVVTGGS